jgi:hypothetical protein
LTPSSWAGATPSGVGSATAPTSPGRHEEGGRHAAVRAGLAGARQQGGPAGNLTDDRELRHTEGGIARARFRVAVSGRREQEASFFTVVVWRDQAEHAAESLSKGSRVVSWASSSSGAGRLRMAAPARSWRW